MPEGGGQLEGSIIVHDTNIDVEVKNKALLAANRDIEEGVIVAGQWAGGQFIGPTSWYDLEKHMYALRGRFVISEGSAEYVASEIKASLEGKGYTIKLKTA